MLVLKNISVINAHQQIKSHFILIRFFLPVKMSSDVAAIVPTFNFFCQEKNKTGAVIIKNANKYNIYYNIY